MLDDQFEVSLVVGLLLLVASEDSIKDSILFLLHRRVPMVLNRVVCAAFQRLSDNSPLILLFVVLYEE